MNTTVNIIMIICATIIALAAIICDHLFEKKYTDSKDCILSKKIIKIHRNYIAGFLGFAIIMLITSEFGGPCNILLEYLSFASTITSFVLSILAIFVTVQSSSDLYKQFARIEEATTTIKSLSETIKKDLPNISKAGEDIQKTSSKLSDKLDSVVEKINANLENKIMKIENKLDSLDSSNKGPEDTEQPTNSSDEVNFATFRKGFLSITSINGLLAIYACSLSNDNSNKEFELSKLFNGKDAYIYGFLIATASTKFIRLIVTNQDKVKCDYSEFNCTEIKDAFKNRFNKYNGEQQQKIINKINIIHEHFDVTTISSIDEL